MDILNVRYLIRTHPFFVLQCDQVHRLLNQIVELIHMLEKVRGFPHF